MKPWTPPRSWRFTATPASLSKVLLRQREALSGSEAPIKRAILFTDLQRSTTDVENWTNDSARPHCHRTAHGRHAGQPEH